MQDWMIVLLIGGVVIFGAAKLPQIARNMGKAQGEFKKGLKGIEDDVEQVDYDVDKNRSRPVLTHEQSKPGFKFDPYTGKPIEEPAGPSTSST